MLGTPLEPPAQREAAEASRASYERALLDASYGTVTTEIAPETAFYYAEPYNQQYLARTGTATAAAAGVLPASSA